jgi:hypothetical protein
MLYLVHTPFNMEQLVINGVHTQVHVFQFNRGDYVGCI